MKHSKQIGPFAAFALAAFLATDATAEEAAAATDQRHPGEGIEEIVVTSELREQSIDDVPVSVTAITSEQRVNMGITTIADLANFTPGFTYGPGDRPSIRGIGRMSNNLGIDNAIATYADGAWTNSVAEAGKDAIFVERSEILRGPQGTLYGRNSIGGAINVISKRPTDYFELDLRTTFYDYDGQTYQAAVSGPITDKLRYRAAYSAPSNEGFYRNVATGDDIGALDLWYAEGQLEWDMTENIQLWGVYRSTKWNDDNLGQGYNASPYNTTNQFGIVGLSPSASFGFSQPVRTQVGILPIQPGQFDEYKKNLDFPEDRQLSDTDIYGFHIDWDLGSFSAHYVYGMQRYVYEQTTDFDRTPVTSYSSPGTPPFAAVTIFPSYTDDYVEDKKWYSHEVTLKSSGEGALQWVGGIYAFKDQYHQSYSVNLRNQPQVLAPTYNYFCTSGPFCGAAFLFPYDLRPPALIAAPPNPTGSVYFISSDADNPSYAGFLQFDYDITDQWQVTLGARYTYDEKNIDESTRLICFGNLVLGCSPMNGIPFFYASQANDVTTIFAPGSGPGTPGVDSVPFTNPVTGLRSRKLYDEWDQWTGTAGVQYRPNENTLTYLRYSRGYKAGGFNAGPVAADPLTDEETVDAFELGWKQTFGETFQLYSSAFYYDWHDMQVPLTVVAVGALRSDQINIPEVDIYGAEFEMQWQPFDNLFLMGSYAYLHTEIEDGCCYVDSVDPDALLPTAQRVEFLPASQTWTQTLEGNPVPQSPENRFTANASYNFYFAPGTLILSGTYVWRDQTYNDIFNNEYLRAPTWNQIDLRVVWRDIDDRYTLIGFVRNATDELIYTAAAASRQVLDQNVPAGNLYGIGTPSRIDQSYSLGAPRTYGVELQYRFSKK